MGLKALAPYVPKEEFDERIGAILCSLAHPPSSAAAVSTFAALAEWAVGLISEEAAAAKRRAMLMYKYEQTVVRSGIKSSAFAKSG